MKTKTSLTIEIDFDSEVTVDSETLVAKLWEAFPDDVEAIIATPSVKTSFFESNDE